MSIIEKFVDFTQTVDAERLAEIEEILATIMRSHSPDRGLSPEQEAESIRRAQDPNPKYATSAEVRAIFGRDFAS